MERALFQRLSSSSSSSSFSSSSSCVFSCPISGRSHCINPSPRATAPLHRWLTSHFPPSHHHSPLTSSSFPSPPLAKWCPKHSCNWAAKTASISSSAILSAGSGGGTNGFGGGSDGGGGDGNGGDGSLDPPGDDSGATITESTTNTAASSLEDVIFLDVGGMVCGGCASSVKRILESQAHVIHASVNLATEAAVVKVSLVSEVPLGSTKKEVGEALAKHLSSCGFKSSVREKREEKMSVIYGHGSFT